MVFTSRRSKCNLFYYQAFKFRMNSKQKNNFYENETPKNY